MSEHDQNPFGPVISSYTRAQAIDDGTLVDVSDTDEYRETGWQYPLVLTRAAYARCVELPSNYQGVQDLKGRLWDVLYMAAWQTARKPAARCPVQFGVRGIRQDGRDAARVQIVRLLADCGPGDDGEPVITIGFAEDF